MHGCGNDYVYVNGFEEHIPDDKKSELAIRLSNRNFGIGSDGLIFINPGKAAEFEMEMYNADGSRSEMCGNGIRCVGKYIYDHGLSDKTQISVESAGAIKYLTLFAGEDKKIEKVRVNMGSPILESKLVPVISDNEKVIDESINVCGNEYKMTCISMGNPHAVIPVASTKTAPVKELGMLIEHHELFPEGVNTEFIEVLGRREINMRVWERGSGETMACGTGACASAYACYRLGLTEPEVLVHLLGGDLRIKYEEETDTVFMTGPAVTVFEGEILWPPKKA